MLSHFGEQAAGLTGTPIRDRERAGGRTTARPEGDSRQALRGNCLQETITRLSTALAGFGADPAVLVHTSMLLALGSA